jgi:hypothetical protein
MYLQNEQFKSAVLVFPVKSVKNTALFYKEKLGFTIDILWENPNFASVSRGGAVLEFGEGSIRVNYA